MKRFLLTIWILIAMTLFVACTQDFITVNTPVVPQTENAPQETTTDSEVADTTLENPIPEPCTEQEYAESPIEPTQPEEAEEPMQEAEVLEDFPEALLEKTDSTEESEPAGSSGFEVLFLDVGQGDAALVCCDGSAMLIDGGDAAASRKMYAVLQKRGIDYLDYVVATHPHVDHSAGLAGALNYATVGSAFCSSADYEAQGFLNYLYYLEKQGKTVQIPTAGDSFRLGTAEVTLLAPLEEQEDMNENCLVLRIVYGNTAFLFAADAGFAEEITMLEEGCELKSTVLKVGHHGAGSASSKAFLEAVQPRYAVISVGEGNDFGHPHSETLERLEECGATVFRTDLCGDILVVSDGETVSVSTERNDTLPAGVAPEEETVVPEETDYDYVLNINPKSMRFHRPDCDAVDKMKEENKLYFKGTRDEAIAKGFIPCGSCKP